MKYIIIFIGVVGLFVSCNTATEDNNKEVKEFNIVSISTPKGEILIKLHDETPRHKASFIKLVEEHYFDDYTFNRVIENFVVQGGCPDTPEGFTGSPYLLDPEFEEGLTHIYGAVGAGRDDNPEMRSAGCQFYIVQNPDGLHRLDNKYTVFGQVVKGIDIVDTIVKVETDSTDQPLVPITLKIANMKMDSITLAGLSN